MSEKYFSIEYVQSGKRLYKTIKAASKAEAFIRGREHIEGRILKVKETGAPLGENLSLSKIIGLLRPKRVTLDAQISAIRQIAVMANAGLSFTDILKEAIATTENERLREILAQNLADINAGLSFSASLKRFEHDIGKLTVTMAELGEKTGQMADSLSSLADILEEIRDNRTKIKKALRYPIAVTIAMCAAFTIVIIVVVPKFKAVFDKFKTDLPLPTRILLGAEHFFTAHGISLILFFTLSFFAIRYFYRTNERFCFLFDQYVLRMPILGSLMKLGLLTRFTIVFKELNKAGLPIVEALAVATRGIENSYIKNKLSTVALNVQRGMSLTASLREIDLYEHMIMQMINAGEQTGNLSDMLDRSADYYRGKFQNKMDNLSASIEPILIGGIAGFVLLLALGIFMPMWDMAKAVQAK